MRLKRGMLYFGAGMLYVAGFGLQFTTQKQAGVAVIAAAFVLMFIGFAIEYDTDEEE